MRTGTGARCSGTYRRTGTLWVAVRGHVTDPLPSMAGRGLDRAEKVRARTGFNPHNEGSRCVSLRGRVLVPGRTARKRKAAERVGLRETCRPVRAGAPPRCPPPARETPEDRLRPKRRSGFPRFFLARLGFTPFASEESEAEECPDARKARARKRQRLFEIPDEK